jgi:uncharacterized protein
MAMQQLPGEIIHVRVTTKAASNLLKRELKEDGSLLYKVYVTVVPEGGKANEAVIKLLSREFGIAKSRFEIVRGHTVRDKTIRITL